MTKTKRAPLPEWVTETLDGLPALLTADETADVLRCSRRSVSRLIAEGRLSALRSDPTGSSKLLIPRRSLGELLTTYGAA